MPLKKIKFLTFFLTFLGLIEFPLLSMADPPVIPPTTLPELRPPSAAGQILQDIDRGQLKRPSQSPRGTEPAEPGQANQEAKTIVIKRFKFVGNTLLSDDALTLLLNSLLIEPISISELKNAVNLITESYRTRGYLVSVSIPEQDITEGVLTLKIIESKLGKVKIDGAYKKDFFRVNPSIVFKNRVNDITANTHSLTVAAQDPNGVTAPTIQFGGDVGSINPLNNLSATANGNTTAGNIRTDGNVSTFGNQTFASNSITINGSPSFSSANGTIALNLNPLNGNAPSMSGSGTVNFNGRVSTATLANLAANGINFTSSQNIQAQINGGVFGSAINRSLSNFMQDSQLQDAGGGVIDVNAVIIDKSKGCQVADDGKCI